MGEIEIKNRLTENNVYDWTPQSPIRFYHGQDDPIVPYTNSVTAQSVMTANSAGASDVLVVDCPAIPADHAYCYYPYLDYMAGYFLSF